MHEGIVSIVMQERDGAEDGIAGHRAGEDAAVVEVEEGVEHTAHQGEEQRAGERIHGAAFRRKRFGRGAADGIEIQE